MEIEITINKWLSSLDNNLRKVNNKDEVYEYSVLVKSMVSNYSTSVVQLSKQGKELPAKVILRTFAELAITFCWCIKDANKNIVNFYSKNERWIKKSLIEQRKSLKRSSACSSETFKGDEGSLLSAIISSYAFCFIALLVAINDISDPAVPLEFIVTPSA